MELRRNWWPVLLAAVAVSILTLGIGSAAAATAAECPSGLACQVVPAAYQQNNPSDPSDYGNYDLAVRPTDGLGIRFVVIHDTEVGYDDTIRLCQNPLAYVSAHYVVRSSDGQVTQMVPTQDVAWQAGNWWINTHSVGIENEGFALQGYQWYTPRLYRSLARLTKYLADRYDVPLDREHIIGHDQVPGTFGIVNQRNMHWDPGPFFDWAEFMALAGAPITPARGDRTGRIVTIDPTFATNKPVITGCDPGCHQLPTKPANFVYLYSAPSFDAPRLDRDLVRGPEGVALRRKRPRRDDPRLGHARNAEGGIRAHRRLRPRVSGVRLDRDAAVHDPGGAGLRRQGSRPGRLLRRADVHDERRRPSCRQRTRRFYVISFNHRLAFVKADDVDVVG